MKIGILIFPAVEELDFVGPWEIIGMWSAYSNGPTERYIIAQYEAAVTCANGLSVVPTMTIANCPQLDVLLVPGGQGARQEVNNDFLVSFINKQAQTCHAVLSVCTGSFLLHQAGLLTGIKATTHWKFLDQLKALGDVEVVEQRFVREGKIWTSAGVSAGIDMTLAFIAHYAGEEAAGFAQAAAEYYPSHNRYGNFDQQSNAPLYLRTNHQDAD